MKLLAYIFLFLFIIPNHVFSMLGYLDETSAKSSRVKNSSSYLLNGSEEKLPTDFLVDFAGLIGDDPKKFLDRSLPLPQIGTIREYLNHQHSKDFYDHKTESEYHDAVNIYVTNSLLEDDQLCACLVTNLVQNKNDHMRYEAVQIFLENKKLFFNFFSK